MFFPELMVLFLPHWTAVTLMLSKYPADFFRLLIIFLRGLYLSSFFKQSQSLLLV